VADKSFLSRAERVADAYGLVLALIMVTFVVVATLPPHGWGGRAAAVAVASLTGIFGLSSSGVRSGRVRLAAAVGVAATVAAILARALNSHGLLVLAFLAIAGLLTVTAATILRRVIYAGEVEFRTILGAISVYTLLGLLFDFVFLGLERLESGPFFAHAPHADSSDFIFFSYTTLTTTGYGNLVPAGQTGQIFSVLEMLSGQIFLVTLVAGLVSLWRPLRRPAD
jgi:hypothetical protein